MLDAMLQASEAVGLLDPASYAQSTVGTQPYCAPEVLGYLVLYVLKVWGEVTVTAQTLILR